MNKKYIVKILKINSNINYPKKKTIASSCYDLEASENIIIKSGETKLVSLGIKLDLPENLEAIIRPRSSMSLKSIIVHIGTIDSDYKNELKAIISNFSNKDFTIELGDRIAQLSINQCCNVDTVDDNENIINPDNNTRIGGFGSTGK